MIYPAANIYDRPLCDSRLNIQEVLEHDIDNAKVIGFYIVTHQ